MFVCKFRLDLQIMCCDRSEMLGYSKQFTTSGKVARSGRVSSQCADMSRLNTQSRLNIFLKCEIFFHFRNVKKIPKNFSSTKGCDYSQ